MKYGVATLQRDAPSIQRTEGIDPSLIIAVYAVAVGITPEFTFLGIPKVRITDLLLPLIFLTCGGAGLVKKGGKTSVMPGLNVFMLMFFWDCCCLFAWGKAHLTPGIFYLAKRLIYFLVAYCVFLSVRKIKTWNQVVRLVVFTSPLLSISVLHELNANIAIGGVYGTGEGMRASGIIANQQSSTAIYIAIICCLALGAWDSFRDLRWRLGTVIALVTGCGAIFATGSRGGLGCVALALIITMLRRPRQAAGFLMLGMLVGGIAWFFTPAALQGRLAGIFPETQATLSGLSEEEQMPEMGGSSIADRVIVARMAWKELIPQAGLMGTGAAYKNLGAIDDFYLTEWLYHGLIGLGLWIYLQIYITVGCLRIERRSKDPIEKGVAAGAATAMIVCSFSGLHADTFYLIRPMEALALVLGLVAARTAMNETDTGSPAAPPAPAPRRYRYRSEMPKNSG